jgi:hypothetical protein
MVNRPDLPRCSGGRSGFIFQNSRLDAHRIRAKILSAFQDPDATVTDQTRYFDACEEREARGAQQEGEAGRRRCASKAEGT